MMMNKSYSSLVRHPDNAALFKAIEMSILAAEHGQPLHIHAEGLRGTGKTTIIRSAKGVLPKIERVTGCLYNCDPKAPHCPAHRHLNTAELLRIGTEWVPMPFLEVSHSAKVATVVGGVDLTRLTDRQHPEAALLPGTLAQAHRGIIFVDEINRLADTSPELADILLDVMGTKPGRLQIEDAGLPKVELVSQVTVWAASNPDEDPGPLEGIRRQLADRFDLCIGVRRPSNLATVMAILQQVESKAALALSREQLFAVRARLNNALHSLEELRLDHRQLNFLARIYLQHNLESLRALEAICLGTRMHAALEGKDEVDVDDLRAVIPMALKHRAAPHVLADVLDALTEWQHAADTEAIPEPIKTRLQPQPAQPPSPEPEDEPQPIGSNRQSFLTRLLGNLRDRPEEQPTPHLQNQLQPQSGSVPLQGKSAAGEVAGPSVTDPELITITAPPAQAKSVKELPEARLIMTEEALRRDQ
jgi:magnesium chelatase subunit I